MGSLMKDQRPVQWEAPSVPVEDLEDLLPDVLSAMESIARTSEALREAIDGHNHPDKGLRFAQALAKQAASEMQNCITIAGGIAYICARWGKDSE